MDASAGNSPREKWRRRGLPLAAAFGIWLGWASLSIFLFNRSPAYGPLLSLLILGGLTGLGFAASLLWIRRDVWRQRRDDLRQSRLQSQRISRLLADLVLVARVSSRWQLPLRTGGYEASTEALSVAYELIRQERPQRILELGSGISTVVMAYALESNGMGELLALENAPDYAKSARGLLAEHGHAERARVLDAPLQRIELGGESRLWYSLASLPPNLLIDFLFVDGPAGPIEPMIRYPALPLLRERLADDAIILVDDTDREQEAEMLRRWQAAFPELQVDIRYANAGGGGIHRIANY